MIFFNITIKSCFYSRGKMKSNFIVPLYTNIFSNVYWKYIVTAHIHTIVLSIGGDILHEQNCFFYFSTKKQWLTSWLISYWLRGNCNFHFFISQLLRDQSEKSTSSKYEQIPPAIHSSPHTLPSYLLKVYYLLAPYTLKECTCMYGQLTWLNADTTIKGNILFGIQEKEFTQPLLSIHH